MKLKRTGISAVGIAVLSTAHIFAVHADQGNPSPNRLAQAGPLAKAPPSPTPSTSPPAVGKNPAAPGEKAKLPEVAAQPIIPVSPHVRALPYPFAHSLAVANDVDQTTQAELPTYHEQIHHNIGLSLGDSVWIQPQVSMLPLPGIYLWADTLSYGPKPQSSEGSIYAETLRHWHRGDFDHIHSWTQDSFPIIEANPEKTLAPSDAAISVDLDLGRLSKSKFAQVITVYYSGTLPTDLGIEVVFPEGERFTISRSTLDVSPVPDSEGRQFFSFAVGNAMLAGHSEVAANNKRLTVKLSLPSCRPGNEEWFGACNFTLLNVRLSAFGRALTNLQTSWLKEANVRPVISTAHGGRTLAPTFSDLGTGAAVPPMGLGSDIHGAIMRTTPGAADRRTPFFVADSMRDLGLVAIWPYYVRPDRQHGLMDGRGFRQVIAPFLEGVYYFNRTTASVAVADNAADTGKLVRRHWPELGSLADNDIFCGKICDISQGYFFHVLVRESLALAVPGTHIHHLWYTHIGSGDGSEAPNYYSPLNKNTLDALNELSERFYNFKGDVKDGARIWVLPPSVWIRYLITQRHLAENLSYDAATHQIGIKRWTDPVTGHQVPDRTAGTRDLHGVTLYGDDPKDWSVVVDGTPVKTVVVNPTDETGRTSYTIVDDNAPTPILDEIALEAKDTETRAGKTLWSSGEAAYGNEFLSLEAGDDGMATTCFAPQSLDLWNTSHLGIAVRGKEGAPLQWNVDLDMTDGGRVTMSSSGPTLPLPQGATWILAEKPGFVAKGWQHFTEPVAGPGSTFGAPIKIADSIQRPALPLGRVSKVCVSAKTDKGARVDFDGFRALRPSTTGEAPDSSVVVGGRVTDENGIGTARVPIMMTLRSGVQRNTSTDIGGYYFFYGLARNEIAEVVAKTHRQRCTPLRGRQVQILKNEVELDIKVDASHCS